MLFTLSSPTLLLPGAYGFEQSVCCTCVQRGLCAYMYMCAQECTARLGKEPMPAWQSWVQRYHPVLKVVFISVRPRHPSVLTQLFGKTGLARINTVINYSGSLGKQVHAQEGGEGRDRPWLDSSQAGWPRRVLAGSHMGLTEMRNEESAEKLMAPADCTG